MSKGKYNLVCVAHPDDETIFMGGLLQRRVNALPWVVVCVTFDGNSERKRQFAEACRALGVDSWRFWDYPDRYESRLPVATMAERLQIEFADHPAEIYTHGIIGEYGHPHHQDVSYAVHRAFVGHPRLWAVAYNAHPEFSVQLSAEEFSVKARVLNEIYGSETSRFLNVLPATASEGFRKQSEAEVGAVYGFLAQGLALDERSLGGFTWLKSYLPVIRDLRRPF